MNLLRHFAKFPQLIITLIFPETFNQKVNNIQGWFAARRANTSWTSGSFTHSWICSFEKAEDDDDDDDFLQQQDTVGIINLNLTVERRNHFDPEKGRWFTQNEIHAVMKLFSLWIMDLNVNFIFIWNCNTGISSHHFHFLFVSILNSEAMTTQWCSSPLDAQVCSTFCSFYAALWVFGWLPSPNCLFFFYPPALYSLLSKQGNKII